MYCVYRTEYKLAYVLEHDGHEQAGAVLEASQDVVLMLPKRCIHV